MKETSPFISAFLELLRAGLWGHTPNSRFFEGFTPVIWRDLLTLSLQQGVAGLVADGIRRLPQPLLPPDEQRLQWYGLSTSLQRQQESYSETLQEVLSWFQEAGIRCAVFKGQTLNVLYPVPGLRMCGDVDLWFPDPNGVDRATRFLESKGHRVTLPASHHFVFQYGDISFELHSDFLNLPMKVRVPYHLVDSGSELYRGLRLNPEADTVMILTHIAHHFLETGIGMRHLCDWAVWLHRYAGTPEVQRGLAEIRRLGADNFLTEFTALAINLLGLQIPQAREILSKSQTGRQELLLEEIFIQGNLGKMHLAEKEHTALPLFYLRSLQRELRLSFFWRRYVWMSIPHQIGRSLHRIRKQR